MTPTLEAKDLQVRYNNEVVLFVPALRILPQEVLAIIGPNGAGKSTLLRVLGFLERPTGGSLRFRGTPVPHAGSALLALNRRVTVVFQEPLLLDMSVRKNVNLGLRMRGIRNPRRSVEHWLERFGIAHLAERRARSLSGGEAQRASLARAFVLGPEVLLLDEPFSALDPPTRDSLLSDLKEILSETRTTTVCVTHDRDEALALGDRVAVMMAGMIRQLDVPERIFGNPVDEEVARFVGVETILAGEVTSAEDGLVSVQIDGQQMDIVGSAEIGDHVLVGIRPQDIVLSKSEMGPSSMRNTLRGRVRRLIPLGPSVRVIIDCGAPVVAYVTHRSCEDMGLGEGVQVMVSFKATAAHLIRKG